MSTEMCLTYGCYNYALYCTSCKEDLAEENKALKEKIAKFEASEKGLFPMKVKDLIARLMHFNQDLNVTIQEDYYGAAVHKVEQISRTFLVDDDETGRLKRETVVTIVIS